MGQLLGEPRDIYLAINRLTALFWEHIRPYGEVNLDLGRRPAIGAVPEA